MSYITVRYERQKLYDEVWSEPVTKVAERYGISGVAIRKICIKLGVPVPQRGYWARIAAGRQVPKRALPKHSGPTEIVRHRLVQEKKDDEAAPPEPESITRRREFEAKPENRIIVRATLEDPHPRVSATRRGLRSRGSRDSRKWPMSRCQGALEVSVSEASVERALCVLDALAKALDSRGMPFKVQKEEPRNVYIAVGEEKVTVRLTEKSTRTERPPTAEERAYMKRTGSSWYHDRYVYHATGLLSLAANGEFAIARSVADGKRERLEDKLNDFIVMLEEIAVRQKLRREERAREEREWQERERRRQAREWKKSEELQKIKELEEEAKEWRRAVAIRTYVSTVEAEVSRENGAIDPQSELGRWIVWARSRADWIDPLVRAKCPVLDMNDD